jgi:flavin reductase (DIM6/NTAB) family NADH-FMN oxidoreductase RutF
VSPRQGIARLTRVATPTSDTGLMPPPKPFGRAGGPEPGRTGNGTTPPALPPHTGVAKLTPRAAAVEAKAKGMRQVMGRFATGVTVVTTTDRDMIHGMTANGFLSVSLRPPLVLVSLGRCRMNEMLPKTGRYGISVLAQDQDHFAAHFAAQRTSPVDPQFVWHEGLPLLDGALAHVACRIVDAHRAGDHVLWIGEVEHLYHRDGEPLLFYTGRFGTVRHIGED